MYLNVAVLVKTSDPGDCFHVSDTHCRFYFNCYCLVFHVVKTVDQVWRCDIDNVAQDHYYQSKGQ